MGKIDVISSIRAGESGLRAHGVRSLSLFGSYVREEARPDSDVDLLVEFDRPVGLFQIIRVQLLLEEMLGHNVDLVLRRSLHRSLRDEILHEAEDILAAA
jgi:uncharacterized protein